MEDMADAQKAIGSFSDTTDSIGAGKATGSDIF